MKRGEVWTASGGAEYAGKPRPVVIVQDHRFDGTASVTVCPITSSSDVLPLFRLPLEPTAENGLRMQSAVMADKLSTIPRNKFGTRVGSLTDLEMAQVSGAILVFLGLGTSPLLRQS